ncbi:MAG: hypothetical protein QM755_18995 [Luteolibacter sp.]
MNTARFRRYLGWGLVGASLVLHFVTVFAFSRQPDRLAAFTVMPIWGWGAIGLVLSCTAFLYLRASLSLVVTAIWAVTILLGADEARVLANFTRQAPAPGPAEPYKGRPVIRLLTVNCGHREFGNPTADIVAWQPDIVLLQEVSPRRPTKSPRPSTAATATTGSTSPMASSRAGRSSARCACPRPTASSR